MFGALAAAAFVKDPAHAQVLDGFAPLVEGGPVDSLVIGADGSIVLAGDFDRIDGADRPGVARVRTDGLLDQNYQPPAIPVPRALALQDDGKLLVGSSFTVQRFNVDGSVDPAFHLDEDICGTFELVLQPDGKLLVGNNCVALDSHIYGVRRLNQDGSEDATFDRPHMTQGYGVGAIVLQADGKIVIGGAFPEINGDTHRYIARLDPDGSLDENFDPDADGTVYALALLPGGDILVGGNFDWIDNVHQGKFVELSRDGHVRGTFLPTIDGVVYAIATDATGVLIAGNFSSVDGSPRSNMARLLWDGSLDPAFVPDVTGVIQSMTVQSDGKIVIGGFITFVGNHPRSRIARINPDGSVDDSFGAGTDGVVQALAAAPDNSLLVGGAYTRLETSQGSQIPLPGLAWIRADGDDPVAGFAPQEHCDVPFCGVNAIALQPDDRKIVLGHAFFTINDAGRESTPSGGDPGDAIAVMRLFPNGLQDPPFDLNSDGIVSGDVYAVLRQPDGKFLIGGCLQIGGTPNVVVARLNADGTGDDQFQVLRNNDTDCSVPGPGYAAFALALLPDGRIVVGGKFFYFVDPLAQAPNFAILRSDGVPDRPSHADGGAVYALAMQSDGRLLVGGDFASINGVARARIARMNADAIDVVDETFDPGADGAVRALAQRADARIVVGGDFMTIGGTVRHRLAMLGADGAVQSFEHDVNASVRALALQSDGKIAFGGDFTSVDGLPHSHVARVSVPNPAQYAIDYIPRAPLPPWVFWAATGAAPSPTSAPELSYSLDGLSYTSVGAMSFDASTQRWRSDNFAPPFDRLVFLRVRAATAGGGVLETVERIFDADTIFANGFD
jgi:uncharacterized delta-60 repeat protein